MLYRALVDLQRSGFVVMVITVVVIVVIIVIVVVIVVVAAAAVVQVGGMTVMKDVSIVKSEYGEGERAINKIQDFQVSVV